MDKPDTEMATVEVNEDDTDLFSLPSKKKKKKKAIVVDAKDDDDEKGF